MFYTILWKLKKYIHFFKNILLSALITEKSQKDSRDAPKAESDTRPFAKLIKNKDLGEELADVVFVVLCLANQTSINLQEAFDKKLEVKTKRDHDRHHNNQKLK